MLSFVKQQIIVQYQTIIEISLLPVLSAKTADSKFRKSIQNILWKKQFDRIVVCTLVLKIAQGKISLVCVCKTLMKIEELQRNSCF